MNLRAYLLFSGAAFLLFIAGCQQNPTEPTSTKASTISGSVLDETNNPLAFARVVDIGKLAYFDTSKSDGTYRINLELSDNYVTSLYAVLSGYASDTQHVSLAPGDNLTSVNFHMKLTDSSKVVGGKSGRASSIGLFSQTSKSILLKGGITPSSTITFLVVDSLNRPVTGANSCWVKFSISVSHPSGETLKPDSVKTDPLTGLASTTVFSGTKPNAILLTAQVVDPNRTIVATTGLTEGTGLADGNHVSISATKFNLAGRVLDGLSTTITLTAQDQFGNPVADGTPVSFVTNGGGIIKDAFTKDGAATAKLMTGGGSPPIGGTVTVTAEIKGDTSVRKSDSSIVRNIHILFSGHTMVARASNSVNFEIPDGDANFFDFTVSDDYGNPLAEGSSITVTFDSFNDALKGTVQLKGNNVNTLPDTRDTNWTHFRVWVVDKKKDSLSGIITFRLTIKSPNDNIDEDWFTGYMRGATASTGFYGVPASISLADSSSRKLYLAETQLPDTSTQVTFIVADGNRNPISTARKAVVNFSLKQAPSGTHLSTLQDSTGPGGAVTVTLSAGNVPGVAQVEARTTDGLGNFFSALSPAFEVAHGLPDSNQILMTLNKNMFNSWGNPVGTISVNLVDEFGYFPAPQDVIFSTSGGGITPPSSRLDGFGRASATLYGGKMPIDPVIGFGNVSVFVKVHGGTVVQRKIPFLFSGTPIISAHNVPTDS
ncbi:MAG: carboxypeptidase regulatory-like domain-containing protein, partial [Ignavibacteriae bacterium]